MHSHEVEVALRARPVEALDEAKMVGDQPADADLRGGVGALDGRVGGFEQSRVGVRRRLALPGKCLVGLVPDLIRADAPAEVGGQAAHEIGVGGSGRRGIRRARAGRPRRRLRDDEIDRDPGRLHPVRQRVEAGQDVGRELAALQLQRAPGREHPHVLGPRRGDLSLGSLVARVGEHHARLRRSALPGCHSRRDDAGAERRARRMAREGLGLARKQRHPKTRREFPPGEVRRPRRA